jgi:hypothetical protein
MFRIILTSCLLFLVFASKAQTGVYKTFEDYQKGNIISMDTITNFKSASLSSTKIIFRDSLGNKRVFTAKEMWGFIFEGHLFRCSNLELDVAAVIDTGKVCYYENGIMHLRSLMAHVSYGYFMMGEISCLSKSLDSKMYDSNSKFFKEYPEFAFLKECFLEIKVQPKLKAVGGSVIVDNTEHLVEYRKCIRNFNSH